MTESSYLSVDYEFIMGGLLQHFDKIQDDGRHLAAATAWDEGLQKEAGDTAISAFRLGKEELGLKHKLTQSNLRFIRCAAETPKDEDRLREFGEG